MLQYLELGAVAQAGELAARGRVGTQDGAGAAGVSYFDTLAPRLRRHLLGSSRCWRTGVRLGRQSRHGGRQEVGRVVGEDRLGIEVGQVSRFLRRPSFGLIADD